MGLLSAVALALVLLATSPALAKRVGHTSLDRAQVEIPEHLLLDVAVVLFDPGLPAQDENALEDEGVYADIRKTEARYLAVQLMETLQSTALWGAVRVVPQDVESADLIVRGAIAKSNGLKLELVMRAYDVAGRDWLDRRYKAEAQPSFYREGADRPPFQDVFNAIANDLAKKQRKLDAEEIQELREISRLRFASYLAPAVFEGYLGRDRKGRHEIERLPATGDPMMTRVETVRERDYLLIDTVSAHYVNFGAQVAESYEHWRKFSFEEELARRKVRNQARARGLLGALAIVGAVVAGGDGSAADAGRDLAIFGGIAAIESAMQKAQEAKMHRTALRELAISFDTEVSPMLVEVEGQTLRLAGTAEAQFAEWRDLLHQIFAEETGIPLDPDTRAPAGRVADLPLLEAEAEAEAPGGYESGGGDEVP